MILQNLKSFNNSILSEQKLELIENKQRKFLQRLRKEYEILLNKRNKNLTSSEKLKRLKNVHNLYTFKFSFERNQSKERKKSEKILKSKSKLELTSDEKCDKLKNIRDSYTFKLPSNINKVLNEQRNSSPPAEKIINRPRTNTQRVRSTEINIKSIAENIVNAERLRSSPSVQLHKRKTLHKKYTFKLPTVNGNYESGDNEVHEKFKTRSLLPNGIRSKMIAAGNVYSKNNQNVPILRKLCTKTPEELKLERIEMARKLGNRFSMNFKQNFRPFVIKNDEQKVKLHRVRKSFKELVSRREKLELTQRNSIKFNRALPDGFVDQYLEVMEQIFIYEDTFGYKVNELDSFLCQEILQLNRVEIDQNLINALQCSNIFETEVKENSRQIFHAVGGVNIEEILHAAHVVTESVDKATIADDASKLFMKNDPVKQTSLKYQDLEILNASDDEETEYSSVKKYILEILESCLKKISMDKASVVSFTSIESSNEFIINASNIMKSSESIEENADNRQKLLSSHEICKCNGMESSTSSMFETASEGDVSATNYTRIRPGCNETYNDDNDYVNECTNEYSDKMKMRCNASSIEVVRRIINFCNE